MSGFWFQVRVTTTFDVEIVSLLSRSSHSPQRYLPRSREQGGNIVGTVYPPYRPFADIEVSFSRLSRLRDSGLSRTLNHPSVKFLPPFWSIVIWTRVSWNPSMLTCRIGITRKVEVNRVEQRTLPEMSTSTPSAKRCIPLRHQMPTRWPLIECTAQLFLRSRVSRCSGSVDGPRPLKSPLDKGV